MVCSSQVLCALEQKHRVSLLLPYSLSFPFLQGAKVEIEAVAVVGDIIV